jgi:hypothetical protein
MIRRGAAGDPTPVAPSIDSGWVEAATTYTYVFDAGNDDPRVDRHEFDTHERNADEDVDDEAAVEDEIENVVDEAASR